MWCNIGAIRHTRRFPMSWMQIARLDAIPLLFTWMQTYTGNSKNGEMAQTLTNGEYQIWLVIYTIPIRVLYRLSKAEYTYLFQRTFSCKDCGAIGPPQCLLLRYCWCILHALPSLNQCILRSTHRESMMRVGVSVQHLRFPSYNRSLRIVCTRNPTFLLNFWMKSIQNCT